MAWSRKKLIAFGFLIFAGQIGAIFALHTREPLRSKFGPIIPSRPVAFATNSVGTEVEELNDPLVFAGAHEQGFSAHAWMKRPPMELAMTNSIPPPAFLEFQRTPTEFPGTNQFRGLTPDLPFVRLPISNPPPKGLPVLVRGLPADRQLITKIIPPPQIDSALSSNTVVQVAVQSDGYPFSTRILTGSGSVSADLTALQLARNARFAPTKSTDLQWAELVFQWQLANTNAPTPATK